MFLVKHRNYKTPLTQVSDPKYWKYVVPHFQRTRVVRLVASSGNEGRRLHLTCSCKQFSRQGVVCRHMFCILCTLQCRTAGPQPEDAVVRWHQSCSYFYGKDTELTILYDRAIDNEPIGPEVYNQTRLLHDTTRNGCVVGTFSSPC